MTAQTADATPDEARLMALMTRERWIEVARIAVTGLIALLFWQGLAPIQVLWVAIAIGLYPLVKTGVLDLIHEHKVGTEILVTVPTLVAVFGGETVESVPKDKGIHALVSAGTVVDSGALDIRTERLATDTTFSRIIALVESAEAETAPVQKLADKVASPCCSPPVQDQKFSDRWPSSCSAGSSLQRH